MFFQDKLSESGQANTLERWFVLVDNVKTGKVWEDANVLTHKHFISFSYLNNNARTELLVLAINTIY